MGIQVKDLENWKSEASPEKTDPEDESRSPCYSANITQETLLKTKKRRPQRTIKSLKASKKPRTDKSSNAGNDSGTDYGDDYDYGDDDDEYTPEPRGTISPQRPTNVATRNRLRADKDKDTPKSNEQMACKEIICDLLGVGRHHSALLSLEELRTYARAYNDDLRFEDWFHPSLPDLVGRTFLFFTKNYQQNWHVTALFPSLSQLAIERGDLFENGKQDFNRNSTCMFSTNGKKLHDEALGVIDNPFGRFGYDLGTQTTSYEF